ncbi:hypothetical protein KUW04_08875 [Halomonas denitrificans]|nr:hypothetical protein [Halomonas denitrificans]
MTEKFNDAASESGELESKTNGNKVSFFKNTELIKAYSQGAALFVLPIALAIITVWHNHLVEQAKLRHLEAESKAKIDLATEDNKAKRDSEYIKLGIEILKESPSPDNRNLRTWAVDLINNYSDIKMSPEARSELVTVVTIAASESSSNRELVLPGHTRHQFKWQGDGSPSYSFEVERRDGEEWVQVTGISTFRNSATVQVPMYTDLRWKAYSPKQNRSEVKWQRVIIESTLRPVHEK